MYKNERNRGIMANFIAHPRSDLLFSLEYRHLRSVEFPPDLESAHHINLSMGVRF